jgi:hypothetical protein
VLLKKTVAKILLGFKLKAVQQSNVSPKIAKINIRTGTIIIPAEEKIKPHNDAIPMKAILPVNQTASAFKNESVAMNRTRSSLNKKMNSVKYHILIINSKKTLVKNPPDMWQIYYFRESFILFNSFVNLQ